MAKPRYLVTQKNGGYIHEGMCAAGGLFTLSHRMRLWKMVFLGCILLIVFLSSFPWLVEPPHWGRVRWIPFLDVLRSPRWMLRDTITNFFLYLPLGFSYARLRRSSVTKMIFKAALAGLFLSMSCEFYQVFSPVRFPTMTDVCMNTLGAFAGALLATRYPSSQAHSPSQR